MKPTATVLVLCSALLSSWPRVPAYADTRLPPPSPKVVAALTAAKRFLARYPDFRSSIVPKGTTLKQKVHEIVVRYQQRDGSTQVTRLDTLKDTLVDFGTSLNGWKDRANLLSVYTLVYSKLPHDLQANATPPAALATASLRTVQQGVHGLYHSISANISSIISTLSPGVRGVTLVNPIGDCSAETGADTQGPDSETSARCDLGDYDPSGLFINDDFPLKPYLTCIKKQGHRGTCVAQATAATIESLALLAGGAPEDLSEQTIYFHGEVSGDSQIGVGEMETSGLSTPLTLDALRTNKFGIPYESAWAYNQSPDIGPLTLDSSTFTDSYPDSCGAGYTGQACSNYSWQTDASFVLVGLPIPAAPPSGTAVHHVTSDVFLPLDTSGGVITETTLDTAILLLATKVPLVVSITTTDAFGKTPDGYVRYVSGDMAKGGHAIELIGFVPNSELPDGVAPATESGFFVVKNSWGIKAGDCGFYYMDFGYLRRQIRHLAVIGID